jgi:hypothetical protein
MWESKMFPRRAFVVAFALPVTIHDTANGCFSKDNQLSNGSHFAQPLPNQ